MQELDPVTVEAPETGPGDRRVGHLLERPPEDTGVRVAIVGFPCDLGVVRNNGRPGASEGPDALRHWLYRFTPDARRPAMADVLSRSRDLGNLHLTGDLAHDQARLGRVVGQVLADGAIPVVLGGGHETAFGHFQGYVDTRREVAISNIDAHTDVRERKDGQGHSGSPFRQALEHESGLCRGYRVAGLQPQSVSRPHLEFLEQHNAHHWFRDETHAGLLDQLYPERGTTYATFCLDAVDAAFAPGVSAPAADGLHPAFWLEAAEYAGQAQSVQSFDVVELSPPHDVDGASARLAALTVWRFLRGLAARD